MLACFPTVIGLSRRWIRMEAYGTLRTGGEAPRSTIVVLMAKCAPYHLRRLRVGCCPVATASNSLRNALTLNRPPASGQTRPATDSNANARRHNTPTATRCTEVVKTIEETATQTRNTCRQNESSVRDLKRARAPGERDEATRRCS